MDTTIKISAPVTPTKDQQSSPAKFVKPADLFKMRRRTSNNFHIITNSNSMPITFNDQNSRDSFTRSSPLKHFGPQSSFNHPGTPNSAKNSPIFHIEAQSPLKCLNNLADPSPTKNLPSLLKNPFNRPVKRKLNLGASPRKNNPNSKSPRKKARMFELDEDANLEPPKMRANSILSPKKQKRDESCYQNDWTLRTKLKINFTDCCKNWVENSNSIHKRISGSYESPTKLNDKSISIEAIKNASTVYQHPYFSWLSLYPRVELDFGKKSEMAFTLTKHSEITKMMHKDWCESFDDLANLLVHGRCQFFYMCANHYSVLFKAIPSSRPRRPGVQIYISPFSNGMGCELNRLGISFKCPDISRSNSTNVLINLDRPENSRTSFGSTQTRTNTTIDEDFSTKSETNLKTNKVAPSVDSGNISDLDDEIDLDDDDFGRNENEDTSQILESIGLSQHDFPTLQTKRKGFFEADSNTQTKSSSNKPLALIEGVDNMWKLINFFKTNRLYTTSTVGRFACVPPTLLSPCEFRLSTPQYPDVILSKNMIEIMAPGEAKQKINDNDNLKQKTEFSADSATIKSYGPTFVELKGTILPNLYGELHKLLNVSDNLGHTCSSTKLDSSGPFGSLPFSL